VRRLDRLRDRFGGPKELTVPLGSVRFGDFGRVPFSDDYGFDRGTPVDRYYAQSFLAKNVGDIRGRALEIGDDRYMKQFGTNVVRKDILDVDASNSRATFVGDLALREALPESIFDCIVCTHVLQYVYDLRTGIANLHRALKPGGVLLLTTPGLSGHHFVDKAKWYWWLTPEAVRRLLEERFKPDSVEVEAHGNVFAAAAFFYGLATEELAQSDLDALDPRFPVLVAARALKTSHS
jgi:SAM-dependent methyltransferase